MSTKLEKKQDIDASTHISTSVMDLQSKPTVPEVATTIKKQKMSVLKNRQKSAIDIISNNTATKKTSAPATADKSATINEGEVTNA